MIDHRLRCIFVHIPKTGGNSVNQVFGVAWQDHKDLQAYANALPAEEFRDYFKFAIVRNPWERLFSDYNYQRKKSRPKSSKLFLFTESGEQRRFADWVEAALSDPFRYQSADWGGEVSPGLHRFSPQVDWITHKGDIAVDMILRMENLSADFSQACRKIGLPAVHLPCRNRRYHWHYSWYYDEATRDRVADYYRRDIIEFDYRFEARRSQLAWRACRDYSPALIWSRMRSYL